MENLGLDYKLMLAQIINFAVVFYIVKKYIATPFAAFLRKEKEAEAEKERMELAIKQKMEELTQEEGKLREQWKEEAKKILELARGEAEKTRLEIVKQAQNEAEGLKGKARIQIEEEKKEAERQIRRKIVDLGVAIVDKALKGYLTNHLQKEVTQYIIKNFTYSRLRDEK